MPQEAPHKPLRGSETILVVEDDPAVRALTIQVLRQHGYRVIEAAHGEEALRIVREARASGLALLLTDAVMPHMSTKALAEQLVMLCPASKSCLCLNTPTQHLSNTIRADQQAAFYISLFRPPSWPARYARSSIHRPIPHPSGSRVTPLRLPDRHR